jgi:hypothetical protein
MLSEKYAGMESEPSFQCHQQKRGQWRTESQREKNRRCERKEFNCENRGMIEAADERNRLPQKGRGGYQSQEQECSARPAVRKR